MMKRWISAHFRFQDYLVFNNRQRMVLGVSDIQRNRKQVRIIY